MDDGEVRIDPALLAQAKALRVNVVDVTEEALRRAISKADPAAADERARKWAEENAEAIADYNRRIRERGVFSNGLRKW